MNKKKTIISAYALFMAFHLAACGEVPSINQQESNTQAAESIDAEIPSEEINTEIASEETDTERTSEELLDLFVNGSIAAIDPKDSTVTFHITDFKMDSNEWDSYSIGEKMDIDNDGENELIICGPYGGIYLDARNNNVYKFAMGDGNANVLSYTYFYGTIWILYSNRMNAGYECYRMENYKGADHLVSEISFSEELVDANNPESGMKYIWDGKEISYDEYAAFGSKIFAAEEYTDRPLVK